MVAARRRDPDHRTSIAFGKALSFHSPCAGIANRHLAYRSLSPTNCNPGGLESGRLLLASEQIDPKEGSPEATCLMSFRPPEAAISNTGIRNKESRTPCIPQPPRLRLQSTSRCLPDLPKAHQIPCIIEAQRATGWGHAIEGLAGDMQPGAGGTVSPRLEIFHS